MPIRTLTIKGIPASLYTQLKRIAVEHRRSLNREVIECLERSVATRRFDPDELLTGIDALRERLALPPLTEQSLRQAKAAGRP